MADDTYSPQEIPVFFPGSGRFQNSEGQPSGAVGAQATVEISINLRPQWLTGIRIGNVYPIGSGLQSAVLYLQHLDGQQTFTTELTQSNIVVRAALQTTVIGVGGIHWHPFPTPYPWGGGNNLTMVFTRLTSYPDTVLPTVHVTLEGIMLVKDTGVGGRAS